MTKSARIEVRTSGFSLLEDETVKAGMASPGTSTGETLAVVGESGSGKSVTAMSLMRLTDNAGGKIVRRDPVPAQERRGPRHRQAAGRQDAPHSRQRHFDDLWEPMTSLNPVFTVGFQIAEAIMLPRARLSRKLDMSLEC